MNTQRPDDSFLSEEPDTEGHALPEVDESEADTEGHGAPKEGNHYM